MDHHEREKEIRQWIAEADHSAPSEIDGCVDPQAPISVRQAEFLLDLIDAARAEVSRMYDLKEKFIAEEKKLKAEVERLRNLLKEVQPLVKECWPTSTIDEMVDAALAGHGEGGVMEKRKAPDIGEFDVEIKVSELESIKAEIERLKGELDRARQELMAEVERVERERDAARAEIERLKKYLNVYVRRLWLAPERLEIQEGTFTREEIDEIWTTVASLDAGPGKEEVKHG